MKFKTILLFEQLTHFLFYLTVLIVSLITLARSHEKNGCKHTQTSVIYSSFPSHPSLHPPVPIIASCLLFIHAWLMEGWIPPHFHHSAFPKASPSISYLLSPDGSQPAFNRQPKPQLPFMSNTGKLTPTNVQSTPTNAHTDEGLVIWIISSLQEKCFNSFC